MGDNDRGPIGHQFIQGILDQYLRLCIDTGSCLIQDQQNLGIESNRPGEGQQLLLSH